MENNNLIKNRIEVYGDVDEYRKMLKDIKSDKSDFDFEKIIPSESDVELSKKLNLALNLYLQENLVNREKLLKTFNFFGLTRKNQKKFEEISENEINKLPIEERKELLTLAEEIVKKITSKKIFDSCFYRKAQWGTISRAENISIKNNKIKFYTYFEPAINVIMELSRKYEKLTFHFKYNSENDETSEIVIKNGERKTIIGKEPKEMFSIAIRENVLI